MRLLKLPTFVLCLCLVGAGLYGCTEEQKQEGGTERTDAVRTSDTSQEPFPDFGHMPSPTEYKGPVFKLSQDYPETMPDTVTLPPFFQTDFKTDWRTYMMQVREYCYEGNLEVDWRVENNTVRKWFHMPWQHYGPMGREGVHGLTKEAPIAVKQLAPTQTDSNTVTWAVGFYNELGGYTIGRVWQDHMNPDLSYTNAADGGGFLQGTVVCKILFVSLPKGKAAEQVPSLVNPIQWEAYITPDFASSDREMGTITLIQMDIMVRDDRAPTGWVFGTFQYNGALNNDNPWHNMVPVGMQWGNDPENTTDASNPTPTRTIINPDLKGTVINPDSTELPATHLGWNGRLNGPVDNPRSACMSCHSTAEYPALSPITPFFQENPPPPGSKQWMRWFRNLQCGTPFDEGAKSTDYSLQMSQGIQNFWTWYQTKDGLYASAYSDGEGDDEKYLKLQGQRIPTSTVEKEVFPVTRNHDAEQ